MRQTLGIFMLVVAGTMAILLSIKFFTPVTLKELTESIIATGFMIAGAILSREGK